MKWIFALAPLLFFTLAGCQIESSPQSSSRLGSGEKGRSSTAEAAASSTGVPDQTSATVKATTPKQANDMDMIDDKTANANVLFVKAQLTNDGTWTFAVTLEHEDTGWEDYADGWDVVLPDGTVVRPDEESPFTRLLLHPHEAEQPFTRSQNGIAIPPGIEKLTVRAHDLVDGFGGKEVMVDLTVKNGPDFEVVR